MMSRVFGPAAFLTAAVASLSLSACAGSLEPPADTTFPTPSVEAEWTTSFRSLDELAGASTVVVRGVVAPHPGVGYAAKDGIGDTQTMATDFRVEVREVIAGGGNGAPRSVTVHLTGTVDEPLFPASEYAFLEVGKEYVLYLTPFEYEHHEPTGKYIITGGVGAFVRTGASLRRTTTRDPLPATVTQTQIEQSSKRSIGRDVAS